MYTVTINGVDRTSKIRASSITIDDVLNNTPDVCNFIWDGARVSGVPTVGSDVKVNIGGVDVFGGTITGCEQSNEGKRGNLTFHCTIQDYSYLLNRRYPVKAYTSQSATAIITDLISTFSSGFTVTNVAAALPSTAVTFDGSANLSACISKVALAVGCYWYVDAAKDIHFFVTEASTALAIDETSAASALGTHSFVKIDDLTQIRTRVFVRYAGTVANSPAVAGATVLAVADGNTFSTSGGTFIVGGQRYTYTGASFAPRFGTWVTGSSLPTILRRAIWVHELGYWVGVGENGAATSPDGVTWTYHLSWGSGTADFIAWSPTQSILVATDSTNAQVKTSPDGVTWTNRAVGAVPWLGVVWSVALSKFVIVTDTGANRVATSPDGITWTLRTAATAKAWTAAAWSPSLVLYAAVANDGTTNRVMTSPDGVTWTGRTESGTGAGWTDITWSAVVGLFVAVGGGGNIMTSPDGITWTVRTSPTTGDYNSVNYVTELGVFIACANVATNDIAVSADGINWTAYQGPGTCHDIEWSADMYRFVALRTTVSNGESFYNDSTAIVSLTGITPPLVAAVAAGDAILPEVQRDNVPAQTALAALEGGDGIHEFLIIDGTLLTAAEANARGDAELANFDSPLITVTEDVYSVNARSGRTCTINLNAPTSVSGLTLIIQKVRFSQFNVPGVRPRCTITAGTIKYTFQDLLRQLNLSPVATSTNSGGGSTTLSGIPGPAGPAGPAGSGGSGSSIAHIMTRIQAGV